MSEEQLRLKHLETLLKMFGFEGCWISSDPWNETWGNTPTERLYRYRLLSPRGDGKFISDPEWMQSHWVTRLYCKTIEDIEFCCRLIMSGVN